MKGYKYHEILFVYKLEFESIEDKKIEYNLKNIEGKDYIQYEWLELDKLDNYKLVPEVIKEVLTNNIYINHIINKI